MALRSTLEATVGTSRFENLELLKQVISTKLNVEMAATREMVRIVTRIHPDQVTLVPERKNELTTTGGLDVVSPCR